MNRNIMGNKFKVLTDIQLTEFIEYLIDADTTPCKLVICASKEIFIEQLLAACTESQANDVVTHPNPNPGDETTEAEPDGNKAPEPHGLLRPPSLLGLANSRSVKLAFCPSLSHLRAYLAKLAVPTSQSFHASDTTNTDDKQADQPVLAILNPIDIHRSTSSFSAQGLNRTFALAVEAAHAIKSDLLMGECTSLRSSGMEQYDPEMDYEDGFPPPQPAPENPWDEEVSMLNVTTKSFGAGGRGWVGRTVSLRRIAERWFVFSAFQRDEKGDE